ncbi:MAG TPA: AI-2E family transporter, partial [Anaerolineae bacterium]|nr:AI-2E family transporter [Anaerolineae bacterium]
SAETRFRSIKRVTPAESLFFALSSGTMPDEATSSGVTFMDRRPLLPGAVVVMLALALAIYLIEKIGQALLSISNVILLVALAWILTLMLRPAVNWIHQRTVPAQLMRPLRERWGNRLADRLVHPSYGLSIFIVYLLLLTAVSIIVLALIPLVVEQTRQLVTALQEQANALPYLIQRITEVVNNTRDFLVTRLNIDPALIVLPRAEEIAGQITGFASNLLQFGFSVVGAIASTLGQLMLVVFLSAFIMIDGKETTQYLLRLVPRQYDKDVHDILKTSESAFSGFIRGTALQGLIYGVGVIILMTIFDVGSPVAVGAITGFLMLIPVVGGVLGLFIPLLAALLQSSPNTWWLMLCLGIFELALFNFASPRLLSQSVKIPSLLVLVAILVGWQLIGFWGFVFAVPIAAVVYSIGFVFLERAVRQHEQETLTSEQELPRG